MGKYLKMTESRKEAVEKIRQFNRFYTVQFDFLNRSYLDSGYSVTETRILFELYQNERINAAGIIHKLHLDKSYISRILRGFEKNALITRQYDSEDRRSLCLCLTQKGRQETERLIDLTNDSIYHMIGSFEQEDLERVSADMDEIIRIFSHYHEEERGM